MSGYRPRYVPKYAKSDILDEEESEDESLDHLDEDSPVKDIEEDILTNPIRADDLDEEEIAAAREQRLRSRPLSHEEETEEVEETADSDADDELGEEELEEMDAEQIHKRMRNTYYKNVFKDISYEEKTVDKEETTQKGASIAIGVLALVFSFSFAPAGLILGIVSLVVSKDEKLKNYRWMGIVAIIISIGAMLLFMFSISRRFT